MNEDKEGGLLLMVAGIVCGLLLVGVFGAFGPIFAGWLR